MRHSKKGDEESEREVSVIYTDVEGHQIFKLPVEWKKGLLGMSIKKKLFELPPVPICRAVARPS